MAQHWKKTTITIESGQQVEAIAPEILSVSRATDIPAFHAKWFAKCLQTGYCLWKNPFNQQVQYISFEHVRAIVFWTKNPQPLFKYLPELDKRSIAYYFLFSLNDYEKEGYEPNVPPIKERLDTFIALSEMVSKSRIHWRFDPLILSDSISMKTLQDRIRAIGNTIVPFTDRLIFSFIEIEKYRKVKRNVLRFDDGIREFSSGEKHEFGQFLKTMQETWQEINAHFSIASCAIEQSLEQYGISCNACVDRSVFAKNYSDDAVLMNILGYKKTIFGLEEDRSQRQMKDPGQRTACNCIRSKDIGQYNTCPHGCVYCYANLSYNGAKESFSF